MKCSICDNEASYVLHYYILGGRFPVDEYRCKYHWLKKDMSLNRKQQKATDMQIIERAFFTDEKIINLRDRVRVRDRLQGTKT